MRISDWSSDVCSSDLDTGVLAQLFAQRRFKQLLHEDIAHRPAIVCRARLDLGKTDASRIVVTQGHVADHVARSQLGDADALQQIGSASCRESGVQYV